jgi:deferrochelatase/peroxidase EfeB
MKPSVIEQTRKNLAALDLSPENAEIAEIDRKLKANEDATKRGHVQLQEAQQALRDNRQPNGAAVAEALISNVAIGSDVMTLAEWQEKADQLRAGLSALSQSQQSLYEEKRNAQHRAEEKVSKALTPLYQAQREAAQTAFDALVSIRAALQCLNLARLGDAQLDWDIGRLMIFDFHGSMQRPASKQPVPDWIAAIGPDLAKLGPAYGRAAMLDTVPL